MSVATVKSVAARFLISETPAVLALKGAWGVGKSFAWNQIITENKDQIKIPNYCYISLFGISSLSNLLSTIVIKTHPTRLIGLKKDVKKINKDWAAFGWGALKSTIYNLSSHINLPYTKNLSVGLDSIAPHLIKDTIICLDDFERLSQNIQPDELLGFISFLKEEKNCKIVLIFNEEELNSKQAIYKKYREKVVDIELLFAPSTEEATALAFPENLPYRDLAKKYAKSLEIKNIRILRKIVDFIFLIDSELKTENIHPAIMQQAVMSIVLLAWAYYDNNNKKPSMQFIREWNSFSWSIRTEKGENKDPKQMEWANALRNYDFNAMDELDLAISKIIESGYPEESGLLEEAIKRTAQLNASESASSFSAVWDLFHNTFLNNEVDMIRSLTESFKKNVLNISPMNLDGTAKLLRELDQGHLADELIDFYIDKRRSNEQLFNLKAYAFNDHITDSKIRERFGQQYKTMHQFPSLIDAAKSISLKNDWSGDEILVLKEASAEDFYNLFKIDHYSGTRKKRGQKCDKCPRPFI